jgi:hypothetical protein
MSDWMLAIAFFFIAGAWLEVRAVKRMLDSTNELLREIVGRTERTADSVDRLRTELRPQHILTSFDAKEVSP